MPVEVIQELFDDAKIVGECADRIGLGFGMSTILNDLEPSLNCKRILNIGVGAVRTTSHLMEIGSAWCVGVEYPTNTPSHCHERFPCADFRFVDSRTRTNFAESEVDFDVMFWNGVDCKRYDYRVRVIAGAQCVLVSSRNFVFAATNTRKVARQGVVVRSDYRHGLDLHGERSTGVFHVHHELPHAQQWQGRRRCTCAHSECGPSNRLLSCGMAPQQAATLLARPGFTNIRDVNNASVIEKRSSISYANSCRRRRS